MYKTTTNIGRNTFKLPMVSSDILDKMFNSRQLAYLPFAIECINTKNTTEYYINVPRTERFNYTSLNENLILPKDDSIAYELVFDSPTFFPLYTKQIINLLYNIKNIKSSIFVQILFKEIISQKVINGLIDQYLAYLRGIKKPSTSTLSRYFQERMIDTAEYFNFEVIEKEPVEDMEQKLRDKLYQVEIRILILDSHYIDDTLLDIMNIVKQMDYYNGLRFRHVDNNLLTNWEDRVFSYNSKWNIFSKKELVSILYPELVTVKTTPTLYKHIESPSNNVVPIVQNELPIDMEVVEEPTNQTLLPYIPRKNDEIDHELVDLLNKSMKQLKLINSPLEVYKLTQSASIQKVQFYTNSQHQYSKFEKEIKNLRMATGYTQLDIGYGDEANAISFYVPRQEPEVIYLQEIMLTREYKEFVKTAELPIVLGESVNGLPLFYDLTKAPHILIGGTTNSGKSVCVNSINTCLLLNNSPQELIMYMIDPKKVELAEFSIFPHVKNVITDMEEVNDLFEELLDEMSERYSLLAEHKMKKIANYNQKYTTKKIPYIVVVIDEYAALMSVNKKIESEILRIGQEGRAAGIHLIIATQTPLATIISSALKAVLPTRIAFNVPSSVNSNVILDEGGAENLLGFGDGILKTAQGLSTRFQGGVISLDEDEFTMTLEKVSKVYGNNEESVDEVNDLDKVKNVIIRKNIFTVEEIQKELRIRKQRVSQLVNELIEEGFLIKEGRKNILNPDYDI